ncbi:MAG TPA: glutaredoxin family protein [Syntrophomonadaceae bacterium]|nr:glutaredoxin family protein [Syntrophomonadaceae bacterium]
MAIVIYTKTGCPHCAAAIYSLQEQELPYTEINVSENPDRIDEMEKMSGSRTVPVIIDNGKVKVGFKGSG